MDWYTGLCGLKRLPATGVAARCVDWWMRPRPITVLLTIRVGVVFGVAAGPRSWLRIWSGCARYAIK